MRWMGVMTLAALGLASGACAAHHHGDRGYHERHRNAYRFGYDRGYDDGYRHGRVDGHRYDSYNYWHAREYRHSDRGYRGSYGSRQGYADGYRRGYERGYRKAFDTERREHRRHGHDRCDYRRGMRRPRY